MQPYHRVVWVVLDARDLEGNTIDSEAGIETSQIQPHGSKALQRDSRGALSRYDVTRDGR